MQGVILAGGFGTRLAPTTIAVNKHLLTIYDKPMIFYSLSNLLLAGCTEILVVSTDDGCNNIPKVLGNGDHLGIKIDYIVQDSPKGIPSAINECKEHINNDEFWVTLGDNFIFGSRIDEIFKKANNDKSSSIFIKEVGNINGLGEATIKSNRITNFEEKPNRDTKGYAVTGLYKFDKRFFEYFKTIKPSKREETEIIDILSQYNKVDNLNYHLFGRGVSWVDAGTNDQLLLVSNFVKNLQTLNRSLVCSPEQIALNLGYINSDKILKYIDLKYSNSEYGESLREFIKDLK